MASQIRIAYIAKVVPDAYHGTRLDKAKAIIKQGKFTPSTDKTNYLGDGVYFYEGSRWHAEQWCKRKYPRSPLGIIRAVINLGKCLDLNNYEYRRLLKKVARQLRLKGYKEVTDAFVINFYATNIEEFDTVRAVYVSMSNKYGAIFPGSKFLEFQQLIICVRNLQSILSFELVLQKRG